MFHFIGAKTCLSKRNITQKCHLVLKYVYKQLHSLTTGRATQVRNW